MTLETLALSRATVDRAAHLRSNQPLLHSLGEVPEALVLAVAAGAAPVLDAADGSVALALLPGADVLAALGPTDPEDPAAPLAVLLGADARGRYVALAWPQAEADQAVTRLAAALPAGARWAGLREVGLLLDDTGAGLLTTAVAVAGWHLTHPRCPRCGAPTRVIQSGWVRLCPADGSEHYPRTDPAVIMAITDPDDRLLLGRQAAWPEGRYSTLAGFVEPGESLEAAVRREVAEETGVQVAEVTYRGNQPWPFPASLMLGFAGRATTTRIRVDGSELADARWWDRGRLSDDVRSGSLLLPPGISIARRLIEDWYGGPIDGAAEAWR